VALAFEGKPSRILEQLRRLELSGLDPRGAVAARPRNRTDEALTLILAALQEEDYEAIFFATDFVLPYLVLSADPHRFRLVARMASQFLVREDDRESAATWMQYAAIRLRMTDQFGAGYRTILTAQEIANDSISPIRAGYLRLTEASILTKMGSWSDAFYAIESGRMDIPVTDDTLSFHAQADLELTKLHIAIQDGGSARYFVDSASSHFRYQARFSHADAILQGYLSGALYLCGRHGQAYTYGLRSVTSMLLDGNLDPIREVAGPFTSILANPVFGFGDEAFLHDGFQTVLNSGS
jgi:hypothetical protein